MYVGLQLVEAPASEPLTLAEARSQCALGDSTAFDTELAEAIADARGYIETVTARRMVLQAWDVFYARFYDPLPLPFGRLVTVREIEYTDTGGNTTALVIDGTAIKQNGVTIANIEAKDDDSTTRGGCIRLAYGQSWPTSTLATSRPIRIRAAFGWPVDEIPTPLKRAMRALTAQYFAQRDTVGNASLVSIPFGVESIIRNYSLHA